MHPPPLPCLTACSRLPVEPLQRLGDSVPLRLSDAFLDLAGRLSQLEVLEAGVTWLHMPALEFDAPVQLPADWARRLPRLRELRLGCARPDLTTGHALGGTLPEEWAAMRQLQALELPNCGVNGSVPAAWAAPGALPQLRTLALPGNALSGTLPAGLVAPGRQWVRLDLGRNRLSGPLPGPWGSIYQL